MLQSTSSIPILSPAASSLDQMKSRDLKVDFDRLVTEIASKLPEERCLATCELTLSRIGASPIELRTGESLPAHRVREIMLRLELTQALAPATFEAFLRFVSTEPAPKEISLLDGLSLENHGLGRTFEPPGAKAAAWKRLGTEIFEGFASVFSVDGHWPQPRRFSEKPNLMVGFEVVNEVRNVAMSAAVRLDIQGWRLQSPERGRSVE